MNDPRVPTITVRELHSLRERQAVELVDVRTPDEFRDVRATEARLIPLNTLEPHELMRSRTLAPEDPVYFICHLGGRSEWACLAMMAAGYSNVVNVVGGTEAWEAAGLPVASGCWQERVVRKFLAGAQQRKRRVDSFESTRLVGFYSTSFLSLTCRGKSLPGGS